MPKQKQQQQPETEEEAITRLQIEQEERVLRMSGLPRMRWGQELSEVALRSLPKIKEYVSDIPARYEACTNLAVNSGSRESRMTIAYGIATSIRKARNPFPREVTGHKHSNVAIYPSTGEQIDWPFTFRIMDMKALAEVRNEADHNDEADSFEEVVLRPDFFILTEFGHEWPSTWYAKLVEDFLYVRGDAQVPTIVTIEKSPRNTTDKNNAKVYETVADLFQEFQLRVGIG